MGLILNCIGGISRGKRKKEKVEGGTPGVIKYET
jgi:hypothetical protein